MERKDRRGEEIISGSETFAEKGSQLTLELTGREDMKPSQG